MAARLDNSAVPYCFTGLNNWGYMVRFCEHLQYRWVHELLVMNKMVFNLVSFKFINMPPNTLRVVACTVCSRCTWRLKLTQLAV